MSNSDVNIKFSDDEFKAYADFIPPKGEGSPLTLLYVKSKFAEAGLKNGIDWDIVNSTIDYCNNKKVVMKDIKVATGSLPVSEVIPHWNLKDKFFENAMGFTDTSALRVDYKEKSPYIMVKKGELIADWDQGRAGVNGIGVKGSQIPFKKKKIVVFSAGRNTKEYEGHLYSVLSGTFEVSETREININDVLHVEGNVDYSTGNITFGKDVIIEGVVKDGFKVAVGGSLYCKSNLDASDVICRKDLIAEQGIIGRGLAIVRVGGKLETKFIENCHVESQTGIKVEKNIMNSQIFTLGHLILGEKGSIVSSHIYSELGVTANSIGKPGSPSSEISIGYSFIEKRSLESTIQRVEVLKEKFRKLNNIPDYRKTDNKLKLLEQIEAVVKKGEEEIELKRKNLYHYPDATVNVTGTVYSGNTITICGVSHSVTSDISRIKFFLDKETHRIETTPLV